MNKGMCGTTLAAIFLCVFALRSDAQEEPLNLFSPNTEAWERLGDEVPNEGDSGESPDDFVLKTTLRDALSRISVKEIFRNDDLGRTTRRIPLSLYTAILHALERNRDIRIARWNPERFEGDVLIQEGVFDDRFFAEAGYSHLEGSSNVITRVGGLFPDNRADFEESTSEGRIGFAGKLHIGMEYEIAWDLSNNRRDIDYPYDQRSPLFVRQFLLGTASGRTNNALFSLLSATTATLLDTHQRRASSGLALTLTQPLLRGRGRDANDAFIRISRNAHTTTINRLKRVTMATVARTALAYWELYRATQELEIRERSIRRANKILADAEFAFEQGVVPALDVLQSRAGLSERQDEILLARKMLREIEDVLKEMLNYRDAYIFDNARLVPTTSPGSPDVQVSEAQSVGLALEFRPEIHSADLAIESAMHLIGWAVNNKKPELDIIGSIGIGSTDDRLGDAISGTLDMDDVQYFIGLRASVPIKNRDAKGRLHRARAAKHQAQDQRVRLDQRIGREVRTAIRSIETGKLQIQSSSQTGELRELSLVAEKDRLRLGQTVSFHVLEVEEDGTDAMLLNLDFRVALEKSLIQLWLMEGTILQNLGIDFETAIGTNIEVD